MQNYQLRVSSVFVDLIIIEVEGVTFEKIAT